MNGGHRTRDRVLIGAGLAVAGFLVLSAVIALASVALDEAMGSGGAAAHPGHGGDSAAVTVLAAVLLISAVVVYVVPSIVAVARHHSVGPVLVVNLLLGWTIAGWVTALAMAVSGEARPRGR